MNSVLSGSPAPDPPRRHGVVRGGNPVSHRRTAASAVSGWTQSSRKCDKACGVPLFKTPGARFRTQFVGLGSRVFSSSNPTLRQWLVLEYARRRSFVPCPALSGISGGGNSRPGQKVEYIVPAAPTAARTTRQCVASTLTAARFGGCSFRRCGEPARAVWRADREQCREPARTVQRAGQSIVL